MARSRPSRGKGSSGDKGQSEKDEARTRVPATAGGSAGSGGGSRRRRGSASTPSPRPQPQRRQRSEKAGSVTKGVQRGRTSRFLSEVVAELKKVSWPDRRTLLQSTAVVLVVVAIVAAYLAVLDNVFERLTDAIF
jgi:preprotein translocase subunit SecE